MSRNYYAYRSGNGVSYGTKLSNAAAATKSAMLNPSNEMRVFIVGIVLVAIGALLQMVSVAAAVVFWILGAVFMLCVVEKWTMATNTLFVDWFVAKMPSAMRQKQN